MSGTLTALSRMAGAALMLARAGAYAQMWALQLEEREAEEGPA